MNMKTVNLNDYVLLPLSDKGWDKLKSLVHNEEAIKSKTVNGKFKEQLWVIMSNYSELFFNGSPYLTTTEIMIDND